MAIARALVQEPAIILADEPIASLDPRNTKIVMDALLRINKHFGITVLCNLHSLDLAREYCDRLIGMSAGRVVFDGAPSMLTQQVARELYDLEADEVMGALPIDVIGEARSRSTVQRLRKVRRNFKTRSIITDNRRDRYVQPSHDAGRRCGPDADVPRRDGAGLESQVSGIDLGGRSG